MKIIKNADIFIDGQKFIKGNIVFDSTIKTFTNEDVEEIKIPEGFMVVPGFIDEHIHGAGGAEADDCNFDALKTISLTVAKSGTTSYLATTLTDSVDSLCKALGVISDYISNDNIMGAKIVGIHMEGPFLTPKYCGAQKLDCIINPSVEIFKKFQISANNNIKLITIAPENDGAIDLIKYLKQTGVTASIGHTGATYSDMVNAVNNGAQCVTHTYNAQSPLHHREIGCLGSALSMDELYTELICDSVHVSIPAMKFLIKNKPNDKVVVITDALRAQGLPEGLSDICGCPIRIEKDCARLLNGTLAGSILPMNRMLQIVNSKVGVSLENTINFATKNPATNIGIIDKKGTISIGKDADFAIINKDFDVYMTIREGQIVYKNNSIINN